MLNGILQKVGVLSLSLWAMVGQANVIIAGTRVVYPSNEKVVSVNLSNPDDLPALTQSWIETPTGSNRTPFIITPPLTRIEPKTKQSLRIRYTGESLPSDRESLYYLNVLDVPPQPEEGKASNYLQITLKNRLKFFFRPSNLPYPVTEAYGKVQWHLQDNQLIINNVTPYHITYAAVVLQSDGEQLQALTDVPMLSPFSKQVMTLDVVPSNTKGTVIQWHVINDYGATHTGESQL